MPDIDGHHNAVATNGSSATVQVFHQTFQAAPPFEVGADQLTAAQKLFDQLPLDSVPNPRGLPVGSYMPLGRNALFVGRESDLKALSSDLKQGGVAAISQSAAITGLGGIGKTQLANEFAYRYGHFFSGGVFWLNFSAPEGVPAEVAACGGPRALNLHPEFDKMSLDSQIGMVASKWQSDLPCLLIFDNCEDESLLEHWTPRSGGCRILVTTRRALWRAELGVKALSLGVLEQAESVALLRKHRPDLSSDDPRLAAIAEELGKLPLALHMAGSFLNRYKHVPQGEPDAYLAALQNPKVLTHRSMTLDGKSPTGHEQHVARTFALSFVQLDPDNSIDALALATLARAVWFARGEPIPRNLLRLSLEIDNQSDDQALAFEDALTRLSELGLIDQLENGSLALHRLLAAFVHSATNQREAALLAVARIVRDEAYDLNEAGYPAPLLAWQHHLREVTESAAAARLPIASDLLNSLGFHLRLIADLKGAKAALERAIAIDKENYGPSHPSIASGINNLGSVLHDQGDLKDAELAFKQALTIVENAFGSDHLEVAPCVNNLGNVLHDLGDLDGAKAAYGRALAIFDQAHGPDHPKVATSISNIGSVLMAQGDLEGAKKAYEWALTIDENAYGPDHPDVATDVNNLGSVLEAQGDLEGAKEAYERAIIIDEQTYGPDHPDVAIDVHNLGGVLLAQGDPQGAKKAFERAFNIFIKAYGPDHRYTKSVAKHLSII